MKKVIPIVIILTAVTAAGIYVYKRTHQNAAKQNTLMLSGNIEAHESLVSFKVPGRIVELPVEEGQQVKQGDLLARIAAEDLRQHVRVDEANLDVRNKSLDLTLAGTRVQEIRAAQQAVIDAEADLEQKKLDFDRAQTLFAKDEMTMQERDLAATALKRATAAHEAAVQRYNEAQEGSRKEEIAVARANQKAAGENLGSSLVTLTYSLLKAPFTGVITVRQAELGEVVASGSPVVTLADLDHLWLRAYVAETDLGRIHWGQSVTVTTDTYPGRKYNGRISFISSDAEFTPKSVQTTQERVTLVYRIKIDLDNPNHELKPGMPADAQIDLGPVAEGTKPATGTSSK